MESIKGELVKLKKEELEFSCKIAAISINKNFSEEELLEIYRNLNNYKIKIQELLLKLRRLVSMKNFKKEYIEFELENISTLIVSDNFKKYLEKKGIDTNGFKFKKTFKEMILEENDIIDFSLLLNKQQFIKQPIYIFSGFYDTSEDCYGPCFGDEDSYIYAIYERIDIPSMWGIRHSVPKVKMAEFEKDKIIIHTKEYVEYMEIKKIFEEELLNVCNKIVNDCVTRTNARVEQLSYFRSPEYKEKLLLDKINELYNKIKGELLQREILFNGKFLSVLSETYSLPNERQITKEKVIKNNGKNSVIVIAITPNKEYIIIFQNRINDKIIAEFPAGYIEKDENPIEAALRELQEETGYVSKKSFIIDEVYTTLGIDNSVTYIVVANSCVKQKEQLQNCTELLSFGLFTESDLKYLINNNIMSGSLNKLAYYSLINNAEDCDITYSDTNERVYKRLRRKI